MEPTSTLDAALTSVVDSVTGYAATLGSKIALVAIVGIGVGVIGFGIKYLWKTFRGTAK